MALPLLAVAARAILGGLKTTIKQAAKKALAESVKDTALDSVLITAKAAKEKALSTIAMGKVSDVDALLLNRLKSKGTPALYKLVSSEMNIEEKALRSLVKSMNQTPKQKELSLGKNFVKTLNEKLNKSNRKVDGRKYQGDIRIKDLERIGREKTPQKVRIDIDIDKAVKNKLEFLEKQFRDKVEGFGVTDKMKTAMSYKTDLMRYYVEGGGYTFVTLQLLESLEKDLYTDIDIASDGSDVWVRQDTADASNKYDYTVFSRRAMFAFAESFSSGVKAAMATGKRIKPNENTGAFEKTE